MPPEVLRLLRAVRGRRRLVDLAFAASFGLVAGTLAGFPAGPVIGVLAAVLVAAVVLRRRSRRWTLAAAARDVERTRPACRNLVITAEELTRFPGRARPWMTERVLVEASRATDGLRPRDVVPRGRPALAVCAAVAIGLSALFLARDSAPRRVVQTAAGSVSAALFGGRASVTVSVHPPAYSRLPVQTLADPERLDVLAGSRLAFSVPSRHERLLRFGGRTVGTLRGGVALEVTARENGYFALESPADGSRTLVALHVRPDGAPAVRIDQPAKDLLLPDANRTLPIRITAADDLELASLELRYTKVSGGGETFAFQEGTLPLRVTRPSPREWRADGELALGALQLQPGESLIYRAVARDRRDGEAATGTSDTFFVEIAGPGQVALDGIDMPPQEERYALSQQMIVVKIERLKARQPSLARDAVVEESALLAAEQRTVRANFVFLLGGHVEDEEVEAEQESEIAEGRLQNTARREINRAIGQMTRAEQRLVAADPAGALPPAREAVEALQRAFGRSRYLLRTLPVRSRIDPARRLSGTLAGAADWDRRPAPAPPRGGDAARWVFNSLLQLAAAVEAKARVAPQAVDQTAENALAVDPASPEWQAIAREIATLRTAGEDPQRARGILDRLLPRVAAQAAGGLIPQSPVARPLSPLERAWERRGVK